MSKQWLHLFIPKKFLYQKAFFMKVTAPKWNVFSVISELNINILCKLGFAKYYNHCDIKAIHSDHCIKYIITKMRISGVVMIK